jgi:hypothetical protein
VLCKKFEKRIDFTQTIRTNVSTYSDNMPLNSENNVGNNKLFIRPYDRVIRLEELSKKNSNQSNDSSDKLCVNAKGKTNRESNKMRWSNMKNFKFSETK